MRATGGGLAMVVLKRELAKKSSCRFASGLLGSQPGLAVVRERWSTASTRSAAASCSSCSAVVAPPLLSRSVSGLSRSCSRRHMSAQPRVTSSSGMARVC
eukprot:scaffold98849_cov61-Phaeocystis_antarctica.AAC.2